MDCIMGLVLGADGKSSEGWMLWIDGMYGYCGWILWVDIMVG